MEEGARKQSGSLSREDLAQIPDVGTADAGAPEVVFGEHWPCDANLQRQYSLELESWLDGMSQYRAAVARAGAAEDARRLRPIRRLVRHWVTPLAQLIREQRQKYLQAGSGRGGGRAPRWLMRTAHLEPDILAVTVLEAVISRLALGRPILQPALSVAIGQSVEMLNILSAWQAQNPALLKEYQKRLQQSGTTRGHRRSVLRHGFVTKVAGAQDQEQHGEQETDGLWPVRLRSEIGLALIQLASAATGGRIALDKESGERRPTGRRGRVRSTQKRVALDEETQKWVAQALKHGELRTTSKRPMLVPPRSWQGPSDGGYYLNISRETRLVIGEHRSAAAVRRKLAETPEMARDVYQALDKLGRTPWRINRSVLDVALTARDARLSLPGLPQTWPRQEPTKPGDIATNAAARAQWRQAKARYIEAQLANKGRSLQALAALREAERFVDEPALYFPHQCDFRGRMYPMPAALNIQGNDLARALLEFAVGRPILDEQAADGLAAHTAKMFGQGRRPFGERIAWTKANDALLRRIATDPLGNRGEWERTADSLWMALAAAREWVLFRDHGFGFVTHLPCFIDGTCNGLQHFAALARDKDLAAGVNVVPNEIPQDIYQHVADRASALITERAAGPDPRARRWRRLLGGTVPRALAKSIVMTRTYGATHKNWMDAVGALLDKLDASHIDFATDERGKARAWLANVLKHAMADCLFSAERTMKWLRETAAIVGKEQKANDPAHGLHWITPTGWPWAMVYGRREKQHAHVRFDGARTTALVYEESDRHVDWSAQIDAITPNVIHALDAAALVFALNTLDETTPVGAIHDSLCGLAPDMDAISLAARQGFVHLYEKHDPLSDLFRAAAAELGPEAKRRLSEPITDGELDVRETLSSAYFFS